MIYVDTSAIYKLLSAKESADEVWPLFDQGEPLISSRLLEIELQAAVQRRGGSVDDVASILARINLDALDNEVIDAALALRPGLRAMDALHLATAVIHGHGITSFATFDRELADAVSARDIPLWRHP